MESKDELRMKMIHKRNAIRRAERIAADARITDCVTSSSFYADARILLVYASYQNEVSTVSLIQMALEAEKKVFCPKVEGKSMSFYRIHDRRELKSGFHGIPEPAASEKGKYRYRETDCNGRCLVIVPGVAFDEHKNRLGYGGGYYDSFLTACPGLRTVALSYQEQIVEDGIPAESTDIRPDYIVTQHELF